VAEKYTDRVKAYCEAHGVEIPPGFFRHPASRYVAIHMDPTPPRLVAKTWFSQEDLVYYLTHLGQGKGYRLLDFKDRQELHYAGGNSLSRGDAF
jgi:hypothetical protein